MLQFSFFLPPVIFLILIQFFVQFAFYLPVLSAVVFPYCLMILQFFLGIGEAFSGPSFDSIFAEHLDKSKHIMDYSEWRVVANFLLVIGTSLGGWIVTYLGFKTLFILTHPFNPYQA